MKSLALIISLFISCFSFGQTLKSQKYSIDIQTALDSTSPVEFSTFLDEQVSSIKLVSIKPEYQLSSKWKDSLTGEYLLESIEQTSIISDDQASIDESRFKSIITISDEDATLLLTELYRKKTKHESALCYMPRHGVAFYNSQEKIVGFIEICFKCSGIRAFGESPKPSSMASEDFMRIKHIFMNYMSDYFEEK